MLRVYRRAVVAARCKEGVMGGAAGTIWPPGNRSVRGAV